MKFIIIGASGFLGKDMYDYLQAEGHEVLGTKNTSSDSDLVVFDLLEHRLQDCISPTFLETEEKIFVVICSALSQIDRCLMEKDLSYRINVEKTIQLVHDIKQMGMMPVFISTSAVYSGQEGYYNEDSVHGPINEYGRQKDEMEGYLLKNVPEAFVLRLDKLVSDHPSGKHMFFDWYEKIKAKQPILCIDQLFSPTYTKDVARSIVLGCERKLRGAYNVANPEYFTRIELAKQFMLATEEKTEIVLKAHEDFNFADPRMKNSYLDSTRFRKATGMQFTSMRELFESYIRYRKTQT